MSTAPNSFRQTLMAGACALVAGGLTGAARAADSSTQVNLGLGQAAASASESVVVRAQKRLLKEKDSPSAVTELGTRQLAAVGPGTSVATLLRQAPSVYVYTQGLGDNAPFLTIRGVRGLEIASTLDDVPIQDLLAPGSFYLSNNIGAVVTTNQIQGVSVYPGVAYPDKNTFGTIGGTIAYDSKRPTNDPYFDVIGSVGSFGYFREGFEANSGAYDSPLGTGDNAIKVLLNYQHLAANDWIDSLWSRENEMEFALDKPYDDGLSKFQATVLYNQADGLIQNEPVPVPYLNKHGLYSNYPSNLDFGKQNNDYLTVILKDQQYINDYLSVSGTAFYIANNNQLETYGALSLLLPNSPQTVNGAAPFINNPAFFGEAPLFGPPNPPPLGLYGGGTGGLFYAPPGQPGVHYNPLALYPTGSKYCPAAIVNALGGRAATPCGLNDQITGAHTDEYGIQPKATITPPEYYGINNTIKIGGLLAKETSPTSYNYLGGGPNTQQLPQNIAGNPGAPPLGGVQRTIYQVYVQDKIDLFDDTLHITPGVTEEGSESSDKGVFYGSKASPFYGPNGYANGGTELNKFGAYKATKWDRETLPFVNVTYDLDKAWPPLAGVSLYGSFGNSALFAPVTDFGPNTAGPPPYASIVHMYEGGIKYSSSNLVLTTDYFYQKVDRDFGYFSFQSGPQAGLSQYSNYGQREFKGVEGSAIYQLTPQVQLFGNFSYLLAKYLTSGFALDTVAQDQYGIGFKGTPNTGIPDWSSTFGVDYSRKNTFVDADNFDIRVTGQYTGHQNTTYDLQGNTYLNPGINFPGLEPLNFTDPATGKPCVGVACQNTPAYTRYNQIIGATTYDPHGGISPFVLFGFDAAYTLPTPQLPALKSVTFDLNVQNLFNQQYFQYFYKQVSPTNCGTIKSGPLAGAAANNYSCSPQFADVIPGEPFSVIFTVKARF
jgi:iron complex outermembrane receptor protein